MVFEETTKAKVYFETFKAFLRSLDIQPAGTGFANVIRDLNSKVERGIVDGDRLDIELTDFLIPYLLFGRKIVYSISLNNAQIESIITAVNENNTYQELIDQTSNLELFTESELNRMPIDRSTPVYATSYNDTICILFASKHAASNRIPLSIHDLRSNSDGFDQIYGVRKRNYQSFDSVIIDPERRTIDFCIDNTEGLSQKVHYEYFTELRSKFIDMFDLDFDDFRFAKNFFKLVEKYYKSEVGVVKEMSFRTNTGSTKTEEMTENSSDLRLELFHSSGVEAIDRITPYSIRMLIENFDTGNTIVHLIPGRAQTLNTSMPTVNFYEIYGAMKYEDYTFIKDNVDELLTEILDV